MEYPNILRIQEHIELVRTKPLTEERIYQYKSHLDFIRMFFPNFTRLNPEIQNYVFRNKTAKVELLMQSLENDFYIETYLEFLYAFQYIEECILEEYAISDMLRAVHVR